MKAGQSRPMFVEALQAGALKDVKVGILEPLFGDASDDAEVIRIVRASIEDMTKQGATAVSIPMPELMAALGTPVEMTVFRKLRELSYRTS